MQAITYNTLAKNFLACEENSSAQLNYEKSFNIMQKIENKDLFKEYSVDNLNNLGFLLVNYDKVFELIFRLKKD